MPGFTGTQRMVGGHTMARLLVLGAMVLALASCGGESSDGGNNNTYNTGGMPDLGLMTGLNIEPAGNWDFFLGEKRQYKAIGVFELGTWDLTNDPATIWGVNDTAAASIDAGLIHALGPVSPLDITVEYNGWANTAIDSGKNLRILDVTAITFWVADVTINQTQGYDLTNIIYLEGTDGTAPFVSEPLHGMQLGWTGDWVTYTSNDTAVVTVDEYGNVYPQAIGSTTITVCEPQIPEIATQNCGSIPVTVN